MIEKLKEKLNKEKEIYLDIKVSPGADKTEIKDVMYDGIIKVNVGVAPEKGKANLELVRFLAETFEVDEGNIEITRGYTSQFKLLKITK